MSVYQSLVTDSNRPAEVHAEGSMVDAEEAPVPECKHPGWQRRMLITSVTLAGVVGCSYGASQLFSMPSGEPETIHSGFAIMGKFARSGEEPAIITWRKHPSKCWSLPEAKIQNGMKLHMSDCSDKPAKFVVPAGSNGLIKPAKYPEFCLDAPAESSVIQFYKCEDSPKKNIEWLMPDDHAGHIKPANDEEHCADVPNGNTTNGVVLQQWECSNEARPNEGFAIRSPEDCEWEDWTEWTSCESKCKDSYKTRDRNSSEAGGSECSGHLHEKRACGDQECKTDELGSDNAGARCQLSHALVFSLCLLCSIDLLTHR